LTKHKVFVSSVSRCPPGPGPSPDLSSSQLCIHQNESNSIADGGPSQGLEATWANELLMEAPPPQKTTGSILGNIINYIRWLVSNCAYKFSIKKHMFPRAHPKPEERMSLPPYQKRNTHNSKKQEPRQNQHIGLNISAHQKGMPICREAGRGPSGTTQSTPGQRDQKPRRKPGTQRAPPTPAPAPPHTRDGKASHQKTATTTQEAGKEAIAPRSAPFTNYDVLCWLVNIVSSV
jgi:hypothetical protein